MCQDCLQVNFPHSALLQTNLLAFVLCSYKRKSGPISSCVKKKPCLLKEQQPDSENMAEEVNPEKKTNTPEALSSEKTRQDRSSQAEKPGDMPQRIFSNLTWTHSLPSTQTVVVSPLSRTEGPRSRPLPPEESNQMANEQKLAGLEKEAQRLRQLLGLEITKTTQGTMTTADCSPDKPKERLATPQASTASREVGCQTDVDEVSLYTRFRFIMMLMHCKTQRKSYLWSLRQFSHS